jgi:peroxiredoxin
MNLDLRRTLEAQGQTQVNKAALTFDYTRSQVDEPLENERFEWTPPEDARDATAALDQPAVAEQAGQPAAMQLVGQAAPNFTLPNLADEQVTLDDLKGEVILLDFWATWCGPCIQAMPHLQEIHDQKADEGLRLFLVNLREDKQRVEQFMNSREFDMPVLMDRRGQVAQQYHVQGIPQTVLIGRDGEVKRVFVGFGPGGEEQLKQAIEQELAAQ